MTMDWKRLLSGRRLGRAPEINEDTRTVFQRDYDRIVYSSAFRRLQDKTQVFPLAESDYVRTRLTHSIEVSCVGRSLGTLVGNWIEDLQLVGNGQGRAMGDIVSAACLAHDIGNPPFGHSGEDAIRHWFETKGSGALDGLAIEEKSDFLAFEGNAQGFRVLARLQNRIDEGGLQLTHAVLGAYAKYPCHSGIPGQSGKVSEKKFGFVRQDEGLFAEVADGLGLEVTSAGGWVRHPLAFLMEAADDICYRIVDLEDGHKLARVDFLAVQELLAPLAFDDGILPKVGSYSKIRNDKGRVEYLRARAINSLVMDAVEVFMNNSSAILNGTFESDLMSRSKYRGELDAIKKVSKENIYCAPHVLQIEAAGFEVLGGLLEVFVPAFLEAECGSRVNRKVLELVPEQFRNETTPYQRLLAATDFVSGMTDSHALTLYRRLRGVELPRA